MRPWVTFALFATLAGMTAPGIAGDKPDIDTSPRVFASASGKYWVRITTKREMRDVNRWTTTMVVYHADGCAEEEKIVSKTTLTTFPRQVLVSNFGEVITLGHCGEVSVEPIITVYGPDGKRRGETKFIEFIDLTPRGPQRVETYQKLANGTGAVFDYNRTPHLLVVPLSEGKVARLSLKSGRPAE
jgi:hypothetical protein